MGTAEENRRTVELEGSLGALSLEEILRNIGAKGQTGILTVHATDATIAVYFESGRVIGTASHLDSERIGDTLVQLGLLSRLELDDLLRRRGERNVVLSLLESERLSPEDWARCARACLEEDALALFQLRDGDFRFEAGETGFDDILKFHEDVSDFISMGRRLASGWGRVVERVPSTDLIPAAAPVERRHFADLRLTGDEWEVLSEINGEVSVEYVVNRAGIGRIAVLQSLASLVEKGLIEMREVAPLSEGSAAPMTNGRHGPKDTVDGLCLLIQRFLEKVRAKSRATCDGPWLAAAWKRILARYPLADAIVTGENGVSAAKFHALMQRFGGPSVTGNVMRETELALCLLSDTILDQAEEALGARWTGGVFNQIYKKTFESSGSGIPPEELERLPLRRKT